MSMGKGYMNCWTDGCCLGNGLSAGRGVFFGDNHQWNVWEKASGAPTNTIAEIQAARRAIEIAKRNGVRKLRIYCDSLQVIEAVKLWIPNWKMNGWRTTDGHEVINKKDYMDLDQALDGTIAVELKHVAAHSGDYGNNQADRLARKGAELR
ncbi:ribonuclease H1-like [Phlebotomus papatasi]|uniref:RNase H type-1 domain-containing protein n=1 Tax=Phlebotomus papatasi TaxID=29031 RepID=A0A1B0D8C3_PHLPP|nr:ribonuclease H1-like [Phlebotomus papatasi]